MTEWRSVSLFHIYFNIKGISLKKQMTFEHLTIASYNIWGLTDKLKKVQLSKDLKFLMYVVHRKPKSLKISILTYVTTDLFIKKQTKRLRKWMSNTQKIRTAYTQSMETKRQNIGPGNTNKTTICMYKKWEMKFCLLFFSLLI